jgi:hypothetical protein
MLTAGLVVLGGGAPALPAAGPFSGYNRLWPGLLVAARDGGAHGRLRTAPQRPGRVS